MSVWLSSRAGFGRRRSRARSARPNGSTSGRAASLVLAGEPWQRGVRWCEPVASDGEAQLVVEKASKLRGEASFEAGWDNHSTARSLRFRASALEGRLVDAYWRQAARAALLQAA